MSSLLRFWKLLRLQSGQLAPSAFYLFFSVYIRKLPVFFIYAKLVSPRGGWVLRIWPIREAPPKLIGPFLSQLSFIVISFQTRRKFDFQTKVSSKFPAADSILHKGLFLRREPSTTVNSDSCPWLPLSGWYRFCACERYWPFRGVGSYAVCMVEFNEIVAYGGCRRMQATVTR